MKSKAILKPVETPGILAEDQSNFVVAEADEVVLKKLPPLRITASQETHWPIRSREKSLGPERLHAYIEVGIKRFPRPMLPVGFGDQARKLARYIWPLCELVAMCPPRLQFLNRDLWLGGMIEHKALVGVPIDKTRGLH